MRFAITIRDKRVDAILNIFKSDSNVFISESVGPETRQQLKEIAAQIESQRRLQSHIKAAQKVNKRVEENCKKAGL